MMINQGLDQGHTLENHRTSDFGGTINRGIDEMRGRSGYWKVTGHHHHHLISHEMRALVPNSWERIIAECKWNWVLMCVVFHPMVMIPSPHAFPAFRTIVHTNQPEWMVLDFLVLCRFIHDYLSPLRPCRSACWCILHSGTVMGDSKKCGSHGLPPNCPSGFWQYMHSEMTRTYTNWYWNGECLRNTVAIFMYKKIRSIWWSLILKVLVANETRVRCPYIMGNISNCMDFELPNCYLEVQYICSKLAKHPLIGETRRAGSYVVMYIIIWLVYIISSRVYIYIIL